MVAKGLITGVSLVLALLVFSAAGVGTASAQAPGLKKGFYKKSCPRAEDIAREVVWARVAGNRELAAKFLRMFFHDCFVRVRACRVDRATVVVMIIRELLLCVVSTPRMEVHY
jgi:hypothetical protein